MANGEKSLAAYYAPIDLEEELEKPKDYDGCAFLEGNSAVFCCWDDAD